MSDLVRLVPPVDRLDLDEGTLLLYERRLISLSVLGGAVADHTVEPGTWERQGWRRRLRQPLHPSGMAKLAQRLAR